MTAADLLNGADEPQPKPAKLVEVKAYIRPDQLEWLNAQAAKRGNGKHQRNAVIKEALDFVMMWSKTQGPLSDWWATYSTEPEHD